MLKTLPLSRRSPPAVVCASIVVLLAGGAAAAPLSPADIVPPSIEYGPLYRAVELDAIFPDSKTFPDLVPVAGESPAAIVHLYESEKGGKGFDLSRFVAQHFTGPDPAGPTIDPAPAGTGMLNYIADLWPKLQQSARTVPAYSTLQPLPAPYVVPGGRFREVYYWDTYFTLRGLLVDGQVGLARDLAADFAYEVDRYGHIPNGNRSYYLSRSQPPFFASVVQALAAHDGVGVLTHYLPELRAEYDFWMDGAQTLLPGQAYRRVVRLPDGTILNRYHDERRVPRDESYLEDVQTAASTSRPSAVVWENLRATAESGWDFSSRWLADGKTLATARTEEILPVDLNSLLVNLEATLAAGYAAERNYGEALRFGWRAVTRAEAIRRLMFDAAQDCFTDYLWTQHRQTGELSAATVYPLFFGVADAREARDVASIVAGKLLEPGGLATTLIDSGQQWDAPNGWAPLQLLAVEGLRNYGYGALASEIATRFVKKVIAGYEETGKLVEKYKVTTTGGDFGGGGEYATQIGFGWTNGVTLVLTDSYPALHALAAAAKAP